MAGIAKRADEGLMGTDAFILSFRGKNRCSCIISYSRIGICEKDTSTAELVYGPESATLPLYL